MKVTKILGGINDPKGGILNGETRLLPTTIVTTYKYHQTICNFGKWQKSIISFENGFK